MSARRPGTEPATRRVVLMAFDGMQLLDLAGPLEVFDAANRIGASPAYDLVVATPGGGAVRTSSGVEVGGQLALEGDAAPGLRPSCRHHAGRVPPALRPPTGLTATGLTTPA